MSGFLAQGPLFETTTAITASGTPLVLTIASPTYIQVTGTGFSQTIVLPDATTLKTGMRYLIANRSDFPVVLQYDDLTFYENIPTGTQREYRLMGNGTSNGTWDSWTLPVTSVIDQDRNSKLIGGGTWSFLTGQLSFTQTAYVAVPGLALERNTLAVGPAAEVTSITTVADIATSLNNTVFFLNEPSPGPGYYVWYNVGGGGLDPGPYGARVGIPVAIATNATANTVASATQAAIDAESEFVATVLANVVTVTNQTQGYVDSAYDDSTGFTFAVLTEGALALPAMVSGQVMYVPLNRGPGVAAALIPAVATNTAFDETNIDNFIIARYLGTTCYVGNKSFALLSGQSTELDQGLSNQTRALLGTGVTPVTSTPGYSGRGSPQRTIDNSQPILEAISSADNQVDKFFGQFRVTASTFGANFARITGADYTMKDSSVWGSELDNRALVFTGAEVNFTTGSVFEADGSTPLGTNFTPFSVPSGQYFWYAILLKANTTDAQNRTTTQIQVYEAASANASASLAAYPTFSPTPKSKKLALVQVFNNAGNIQVFAIRQLGVGASSAGAVTLQEAYTSDPDGGDAIIVTTATDGSLIVAGTEGFQVTGTKGIILNPTTPAALTALDITYSGTGLGLSLAVGTASTSYMASLVTGATGAGSGLLVQSTSATQSGELLTVLNAGTGRTALLYSQLASSTSATLALRHANTASHVLDLLGATSGILGVRVPGAVTTYSILLPGAQGGVNTVLLNDGSGNLSWASAASFTTLQAAYLGGNTITTSAGEGDVTIAGTEQLLVTTAGRTEITQASLTEGALLLDQVGVNSTGVALTVNQDGIANAIDIALTDTNTTGYGISLTHDGNNTSRGIFVDMTAAGAETYGLQIDQASTNANSRGLLVNYADGTAVELLSSGAGNGLRVSTNGLPIYGESGGTTYTAYLAMTGTGTALGVTSNSATNTNPLISGTVSNTATPGPGIVLNHSGLGAGIRANMLNAASTANALWADVDGLGRGLLVDLSNAASTAPGVEIIQGGLGRGLFVDMPTTGTAAGVYIDASNSGPGVQVDSQNTSIAFSATTVGTASVASLTVNNAASSATVLQATTNGTGAALTGTANGTGAALRLEGTSTSPRLQLAGSTSGAISLNVPAAITSYSLLLPATQGALGTVLTNDGSGNLSWGIPTDEQSGIEPLAANAQSHTVTFPVPVLATDYEIDITMENTNIALALGNDPLSTLNTSTTVTVNTPKAHGLLIGQSVTLAGLTAFNGLLLADVTGAKTVTATPTATSFEYTSGTPANATGSGGGAAGTWLPPADINIGIYALVVTGKTLTDFTFTLSGPTDSANYKANWEVSP